MKMAFYESSDVGHSINTKRDDTRRAANSAGSAVGRVVIAPLKENAITYGEL